jgi:hypothetical protein
METAVPVIFFGEKLSKGHTKKKESILLQNSFYLKNAPEDLDAKLDFPLHCRDMYGC